MPNKKRAARRARKPTQPQLLATALASVANAIFITDREGHIVWVNAAFCRLSGYSATEALGHTPRFLKSGKQDESFYSDLWRTVLGGGVWRGELTERRKDGALYTVDETITPLRGEAGAVTHFIAIQNDITERRQQGERDHYLAYHDGLTGLANREHFLQVLRQATAEAKHSAQSMALLFIDVDKFKSINDILGHRAGDRLLVAIARRLNALVRKSDTVARLSGDEFAILQAGPITTEVAEALARKLLRVVAQPFMVEGERVQVTVSIGVALFPEDATDSEALLRIADAAMYQAKQAGRNRYRTHSSLAHCA